MVVPNPSKRVKRRVVIRDYVHIQFEKGTQTYTAALVNISLQGIGCVFPVCPTLEELFFLQVKKENYVFEASAKVKWFQPFESKKRYQVGLEFVNISSDQQEQLQHILQDSLQNPLTYPQELKQIQTRAKVRYGDSLEYEGELLSIQQDHLQFQALEVGKASWELGHKILMEADLLPNQILRSSVTLISIENDSHPIFKAEFPSLKEEDRNLIRRFLVEYYLNSH